MAEKKKKRASESAPKNGRFVRVIRKNRADSPEPARPRGSARLPQAGKRDVKVLCYWCKKKYWRGTSFVSLRNDKVLSLREMTGFEDTLRPYLEDGYEIKHISSNEDVDYFIVFLEKKLQ